MEITMVYFWNQHDRISLTQSKPCTYQIHSSQNSTWPTFCQMTHNSSQALMALFIHFLSSMKTLQVSDISSCGVIRNTRDFAVFPGSMLPKPTSATLVVNALADSASFPLDVSNLWFWITSILLRPPLPFSSAADSSFQTPFPQVFRNLLSDWGNVRLSTAII